MTGNPRVGLLDQNLNPITHDNPLPTTQQLRVEKVLDTTGVNLNSGAYTTTITPSYDYIIDNISFSFSAAVNKTITVTSDNGSQLYNASSSSLSLVLSQVNYGQASGESFTIAVSSTASSCNMSVSVSVKNSPVALQADPVIATGDNVIGRVMLVDNYGHNSVAAIDPVTKSLTNIDVDHGEVHAGRMFFFDNYVDLSNGQVVDFLFVAPHTSTGYQAHLIWEVTFEGEGGMEVYEDTVVSSTGTPVTAFNRNRCFAATQKSLVYTAPSVTSTGTQLINKRVGSGRAFGGNARSTMELVLCAGKQYLFRFTNHTALANLLNYQADWYEVPEFVP